MDLSARGKQLSLLIMQIKYRGDLLLTAITIQIIGRSKVNKIIIIDTWT